MASALAITYFQTHALFLRCIFQFGICMSGPKCATSERNVEPGLQKAGAGFLIRYGKVDKHSSLPEKSRGRDDGTLHSSCSTDSKDLQSFNHSACLSEPSSAAMMPAIKRQASDSFSGPNQSLVKRQKSSSDLNRDGALTVTGRGKGKDGALVQSVSLSSPCVHLPCLG